MDIFYVVNRNTNLYLKQPPTSNNNNNNTAPQGLCTISNGNIVAFTTKTEILDTSNKSWGYHVYVADINTPWWCHKVTSNNSSVTVLEWDVLGKYLLIGDISGSVQIWIQRDNLISDWMLLYNANFPSESILKAIFFNNGQKVTLSTDKREQLHYMEKFQRVKCLPSVRQFGGVSAEGVLIITSTGMLGSFFIPAESINANGSGGGGGGGGGLGLGIPANLTSITQSQQNCSSSVLQTVTKSLSQTRNFITTADISFGRHGYFMVAVANGNSDNTMIQCHRVMIQKQNDKLVINSQPLRSFFISERSGGARDVKVTHLKWICTEDSDALLIGSECFSGSLLELWTLTEKATPLHNHFQTPAKTEVFKTQIWTHQHMARFTSTIIGICSSKFYYGTYAYIFVTFHDNTIHCLQRDTLKNGLPVTSLASAFRCENEHTLKKMKMDIQMASHDISTMGHILIAIDTHGQLYSYKIQYPYIDQMTHQQAIIHYASLLEYCLVSGYDSLDLCITLKISQLDGIIDKITDHFSRQPHFVQQYYYVNFLTMKTNLYRLSILGQTKAYDLTSLLMLHSILIAFKSLLRPSDLISHDKGPAENLAMVLSESVPDIDKVLLGLEPKDFTVEQSTLKSLQQLIQWVADLALNILAKLPEHRTSRNVGYDIGKDIVALNSIRELLVMMRIWGLLSPECLPVFSRSADNLDILATLFRQLTKLALNPNDPDEVLLDECCLLPNQVFIPQLQYVSSQASAISPVMSHLSLPINLEYFVEPNCLKYQPDIPSVEGGLSSNNILDSLRHIQLGVQPLSLRRCTRCGACSSVWSVAKTAAMRAWEQRWASGCKCGGFWRFSMIKS